MRADPRSGVDLPLRMLEWSQDGPTRMAYQDPAVLADRYEVGSERATLVELRGLLEQLVAEVGRPR